MKRVIHFLLIGLLASITQAYSQTMPANFALVEVADNIDNVTCFAFLNQDTILIARQSGELHLIIDGVVSEEPIAKIPTITTSVAGEKGLAGIAIDPDYPNSPYVYINYTAEEATFNRISRFQLVNSSVDINTEEILLELSSINSKFHIGGGLLFDDQGHLFCTTGDNSTGVQSQSLSSTHGKIIRINKDGSIPTDNPYYGGASTFDDIFWGIGLRNPFTMSIHKATNTIFINDVGKTSWEEINNATEGGKNFGWPEEEGFNSSPTSIYDNPTYAYSHEENGSDSTGVAITGGAFYDPETPKYPAEYVGKYFFMEFGRQWINTIDPGLEGAVNGRVMHDDHVNVDLRNTRESFATNMPKGGIYLTLGPDGFLYYFSRVENKLYKIAYHDAPEPAILEHPQNTVSMEGSLTRFTVSAAGADTLNYEWYKNGNKIGSAPNGPAYAFANTQSGREGTYQVRVFNTYGEAWSREFTLTVVPFSNTPTVSISSPISTDTYQGGQIISFAADATDPEDGVLDASVFEWFVEFHHDDHIHDGPAVLTGAKSGTYEIPDLGEISSNVFFRFIVRVTDAAGLEAEAEVDVYPQTSEVTFATNPAGLNISIDGPSIATPSTQTFVEQILLPVGAPESQTLSSDPDAIYRFSHWSTDLRLEQYYLIPEENSTLTAYYERCTNPDAVSGLGATSFATNDYQIFWETISPVCNQGFIVENVTTSQTYTVEAMPTLSQYAFVIPENLVEGNEYTFRVKAYNEYGESDYQTIVFTPAVANSENADLFVFAGQLVESGDMTGVPDVTGVGWEYSAVSDAWIPITAGPVGENYRFFTPSDGGSLLASFADTYNNLTDKDVYAIYLMSKGSALLSEAKLTNRKSNDWSPTGDLFINGVKKVNKAERLAGKDISGIVWIQGRTDAIALRDEVIRPYDYRVGLENIIARFRSFLGANMPFYIVEIGEHLSNSSLNDAYSTIRMVQQLVASNDPNVHIIYDKTQDFDTNGWMANSYAYNQAGLNDIGSVTATNILNINPSMRVEAANNNRGANEISGFEQIMIYPNPVQDKAMVKVQSKLAELDCHVYSLDGLEIKNIASWNQAKGIVDLDMSQVDTGMYILKVKTENGYQIVKFMKQ